MGNLQSSSTGASSAKAVVLRAQQHDMPLWALNVIEYLPWETRSELATVSKQWRQNTNTLAYFRFLCQRLAIENGVYMPTTPPQGESWRTLFLELYKLRFIWTSKPAEIFGTQRAMDERFKISVYAKFRPLNTTPKVLENGTASASASDPTPLKERSTITLPLHQKLAMIRMSHKIKSNRQALKLLTEEGGWFSEKWAQLSEQTAEAENDENSPHNTPKAKVFTTAEGSKANHLLMSKRERLSFKKSSEMNSQSQLVSKVHSVDPLSGRVVMLTPDVGLREFSFDGVLPAQASQSYTYDTSTKRLVVDLLNGFNATAIVYGQTGSGKTYSMFGRDEQSFRDKEGKGIIPRACEEILQAIEQRRVQNQIESELKISYVEIYGDHVSDLLRNGARCGQSKVASQRYVLNGAAAQVVNTLEDVQQVLQIGDAQKRRAATAMNDRSTRAHSLFILTLHQRKASSDVTLQTRLFLADLGGSEQVKKSQVEAGGHRVTDAANDFSAGFQKGDRMREAVYINLGLLALKKCIEALHSRFSYVPYQDSKLTMLLSEGLGGNSKTSIIICANLDPVQSTETVASLRFGERCAGVEVQARNNASVLAGILADLDKQIAQLEALILQKERWEVQEVRREDELAEDGTIEKALGGQEIIKRTVVVGAEEERRQLALLLQQRLDFVGTSMSTGEESTSSASASVSVPAASTAFGKQYAEIYGFGGTFDENAEAVRENERFAEVVANPETVPWAVRRLRKNRGSAWATGGRIDESPQAFQQGVQRANKIRAKLAYSGLSA